MKYMKDAGHTAQPQVGRGIDAYGYLNIERAAMQMCMSTEESRGNGRNREGRTFIESAAVRMPKEEVFMSYSCVCGQIACAGKMNGFLLAFE